MQPNPKPSRTIPAKPPGTPGPRAIEAPTQKVEAVTPPAPPPGKTPAANTHNIEVRRISIEQIVVEGHGRTLDEEKLQNLAVSMAEIGLRTPITVRPANGKFRLGPGRHRLEAAKKLGWLQIDCLLLEGDETDARLWELAENLFRSDLTVLERAESIDEWLRLVEEKRNAGQAAHPGGKQPHDRGISGAARELNITREEVRRAGKIAGISADAKAEARQTGLADNQTALMDIAKEQKPESQTNKVRELAARRAQGRARNAGRANGSAAATASNDVSEVPAVVGPSTSLVDVEVPEVEKPHEPPPVDGKDQATLASLTAAWNNATELLQAWATASEPVRDEFAVRVLGRDINHRGYSRQ
jgi:ParB-like chromosome segregation protein Spo0J